MELLREICAIVKGPVSAEVIDLKSEGIVGEARELAKLARNIVIKIPITK